MGENSISNAEIIIMTFLLIIAVPAAIGLGWHSLAHLVSSVCTYPRAKRICLLISHCDDEAMFFSPTVIRLTEPSLNNHVELFCLSKGKLSSLSRSLYLLTTIGEDIGLRAVREQELYRSAANLGITSPSNITCLDDEESFPDSMTIAWDADKIAAALSSKYTTNGPMPDILITFDNKGISSHANHISLPAGARYWLSDLPSEQRNQTVLYSLVTTNIVRKYMSVVDAPLSVFLYLWQRRGQHDTHDASADRLLFLSTWNGYRTAQRSMTACHKSQMLWFRYGWIFLSRYISTNDLVRQKV